MESVRDRTFAFEREDVVPAGRLAAEATGPGPPDKALGRESSVFGGVDDTLSLALSEDADSVRSRIIAPPDRCGGVIGRLPDFADRADLLECEETPEKGRDGAMLADKPLLRGFADQGVVGVAAVELVAADQ